MNHVREGVKYLRVNKGNAMNKFNILGAIDIIEDLLHDEKKELESLLNNPAYGSDDRIGKDVTRRQSRCVALDEAIEQLNNLVRLSDVVPLKPLETKDRFDLFLADEKAKNNR